MRETKRIVILGSTGSIGRSALDVISRFPDRFRVVGLTAGRNISLLVEQIRQFQPGVVAVFDEDTYRGLKDALLYTRHPDFPSPEVFYGAEGICTVAEMPGADTVISAIVGSAGLLPTLMAIRAGKTVALANKEALVMAGNILMSEVRRCGAVLLPVDSEHSAILQCMRGHDRGSVKRIILTASGGPFVGKTLDELMNVSPEDALKHPNWSMGTKITIDSATLMNKGLEVIEAHHLFGIPPERIDVLIHPQSIIHSIVEFNDESYMAQLSMPDMKGPIAYVLSYPERLNNIMEPIDWERLSMLTFMRPDNRTFPCLSLAYSAVKEGGTMPAVLNAANEVSVNAFLGKRITFNDIPVIIKRTMDSHRTMDASGLDAVIEADRWARQKAEEYVAG